ncbi:MAG: hypothetical protein RLZZ507_4566 [Cyanobacteriota bacterium]|jgi:hypothetical protein
MLTYSLSFFAIFVETILLLTPAPRELVHKAADFLYGICGE